MGLVPDVVIGPASIRWTSRIEGDFKSTAPYVEQRRQNAVQGSWTWLNQVHGGSVVRVTEPGEHAGGDADGIVTSNPGAVLAITTADCIPAALVGDNGLVGALHAGWRGLLADVVANTGEAMRQLGAKRIVAARGPSIRECCYEFGSPESEQFFEKFGQSVAGETTRGTPALKTYQAFAVACERADIEVVYASGACTGCQSEKYFSHRARAEPERMAMIVWN